MNPDSTGFEADVNLMCDAAFGEYRCTRTQDHDGDHVAHGGLPVRGLCSWPALEDATDRVEEQLRRQRRTAREVSAAWDRTVNGQETL